MGEYYHKTERRHSEARKEWISLTLTGKPRPKSVREKISKAMKGVPKSPEHRRKISEAMRSKMVETV